MRATRTLMAATALGGLLLATACGSSDDGGGDKSAPGGQGFTPPKMSAPKSLGKTEGKVNLIAWAGLRRGRLQRP